MKILLLEDDLILNEILEEHLSNQNHKIITSFSYDEAIKHLYSQTFDLLLLDVNVPNKNGFELLKELRKNSIKTPAIFITSLNMVEDMQKGFDSGCDDYIKKPFELKELDLRINNIKRLFNIDINKEIQLNKKIVLDIEKQQIIKDDIWQNLTKKEFEILLYLYNNRAKTISIDEIINNVYSYEDSINDSTIRTYIKNLRKLLGDEMILNIRGAGYRLNI
ncbi:DNA-binding response regulator [Aliarcobacter trophiarum LMG 25534]|uniref:DNA-binding response regulator n=1 Tax=Aliarcobacter trophiarum LMG 25534 TaxID=1032241 RepID=A0AAD0QHE5_9BACT|nr:response regulator transcription factor [Aliarcobacter trophiarum]AXK47923.1 two-component system response regulator, putative CusR [Aliarcobacter trophiarum LMG 25534]RXI28131.1 DNA-binding response regulator [Aliarcobacter trophiarum]RXJ92415.1 DNA-binding response regulator [Aliarcobacter trophiarum LMG 25534]